MMSKKYTLSDNMCLVHISAIVMLTGFVLIVVYAVVKVAYDVIRLEMLLYICVWRVLDFDDAPILKILLCYSDVEMFM